MTHSMRTNHAKPATSGVGDGLERSRELLSDADLEDLLEKTSRTFAVSIPLLDEPTRRRVGLAYLLLRIADNFEDASSWSVEHRVASLRRFIVAIGPRAEPLSRGEIEEWVGGRPQSHPGYLELLERAPDVIAATRAAGDEAWLVIADHVSRSAEGMIDTVQRADAEGSLELVSLQDLKDYCYLVAGIVGELLTELFLLAAPGMEGVRPELERRAVPFGEGLQLVNILKDAGSDAEEGRRFLPSEVDPQGVFSLAREDLVVAEEYVELMRRAGAPPGHLAFTALPVRLAWSTLRAVEKRGAGAKVSRITVARHLRAVRRAAKKERPLFEQRAVPTGRIHE